MNIIGGNKGGRSFNTVVTGLDGHSSLPQLGVNAIITANRIITKLVEIQERLKAPADPDNGFVPPYTTLDLGLIKGGTASNIIPVRSRILWHGSRAFSASRNCGGDFWTRQHRTGPPAG